MPGAIRIPSSKSLTVLSALPHLLRKRRPLAHAFWQSTICFRIGSLTWPVTWKHLKMVCSNTTFVNRGRDHITACGILSILLLYARMTRGFIEQYPGFWSSMSFHMCQGLDRFVVWSFRGTKCMAVILPFLFISVHSNSLPKHSLTYPISSRLVEHVHIIDDSSGSGSQPKVNDEVLSSICFMSGRRRQVSHTVAFPTKLSG
jgi:hypothetical protein